MSWQRRVARIEGQNIEYIEQNANSQISLTAIIANDLAARNPDVIVPITTPMTQAVIKVAKAPVVFASVTDPVGDDLHDDIERPGLRASRSQRRFVVLALAAGIFGEV